MPDQTTGSNPLNSNHIPFHADYNAEPPLPSADDTRTTRSFLSEGEERQRRTPFDRPQIPKVKLPPFRGENVSRFLKRYEMEFRSRGINEQTMAEYLPMYVKDDWFSMISDMPGCESQDWYLLKRAMKDTFVDEEKYKYSLTDLRQFVAKQKRRGKPDKLSKISKVYFKFNEISSYLKKKQTIGNQEESRYFLSLLPEDIVDMIYARRDTRHLVKVAGEFVDDDEEGALPELREIIKEVRAIYANFAKRGKLSKIRSRREHSSSDSKSGYSSKDSDDSESSDDDNNHQHSKKAKSSSSSKGSTRHPKSSRSSDSEPRIERMKTPTKKDEHHDDSMKDLLLKFSEMQVTMAQLANRPPTQGRPDGTPQQPFPARRNSFGNGMRTPGPFNNQDSNTNRWNGPRKDAPPHQANSQSYENTYSNNYAGTGSNAIPVGPTPPQTPWHNHPPPPVNGPFTPGGGQYPPRPPMCLWCAGELGDPHWLGQCKDLQDAIAAGIVRKDYDGKLRYGTRFIPARGHPRGMRAWIKEAEEQAKAEIRESNVRFSGEVKANSIEYDPPEIADEHCEYESGNVRVDEFEVNQTKRPRSAASTDQVPLKTRNTRNYRPRESLFEELGVPRASDPSDKENDTEMKDIPRKRQPPPTTPKPKLESPAESKSDPRAFLEKVLEQPITIPISLILANSPELAKMLVTECKRKRVPISEHNANHLGRPDEEDLEEEELEVHSHSFKFQKRQKSYYAGVLAFANITVEGEVLKALLDNGSMICMMQDDLRRRLGLPIRTDGSHRVRMAGGTLETLLGISENVPVSIGGVTTYVHFFISKGGSNPILLGQNFLRQVEARFSYHADGSVLMGMTHKGRQITVEVTGRDESRYLSRVPGEGRDYDSASITMMNNSKGNYLGQNETCAICRLTHKACISNIGQTPCTGRREVLKTLLDEARTPTELDEGTTRQETPYENRTTSLKIVLPPLPRHAYVWANDSKQNDGPTGTSNTITNPQPKKRRTRNKPLKRNPREEFLQTQAPGLPMQDIQVDPTPVREYLGPNNMPGRVNFRLLNEKVGAAAAAEDALTYERERQEELRHYFETTRTEPWIKTCTEEEAIERAQQLREEYDRFLVVLFGRLARRNQIIKPVETKRTNDTLAPAITLKEATSQAKDITEDARPQPAFPESAPERQQECGSMMFRIPTLRRHKSFDLRLLGEKSHLQQQEEGHENTDIHMSTPPHDEENEGTHLDNGLSSHSEAQESLDYDILITGLDDVARGFTQHPVIRLPTQLSTGYRESQDEEFDIAETPTEQLRTTNTPIDDFILGLHDEEFEPRTEISLEDTYQKLCLENEKTVMEEEGSSKDIADSSNTVVIDQLGTLMEGTIFESNSVEIEYSNGAFELSCNSIVFEGNIESIQSDTDMDDNYRNAILDGMTTDEEYDNQKRPCTTGDWEAMSEYESYNDEEDSIVPRNHETLNEPSMVKQMIRNARERQERLVKVARAQIDRLREKEERDVSNALQRMNLETPAKQFEVSVVKLEDKDSEMGELDDGTCSNGAARQEGTKRMSEVSPFLTRLGKFEPNSTSQASKWTQLLSCRTPKRIKTRRQLERHPNDKREDELEKDQRTLRELREDLNSLLFEVTSVQLQTQNSAANSGKETPLVTN